MEYIAHIRECDKRIQTVEEHLLEVKKLAESYGEPIGLKHLAGLAGMLHDLGKYTQTFRNYILEAVMNPESPPKRGSVDHSTAGGKLLFEYFHKPWKDYQFKSLLSEIVGNAIISHHSYLQDFLSPDLESPFLNRVRDKELTEFPEAREHFFKNVMSKKDLFDYTTLAEEELKAYLSKGENSAFEIIAFLTKFIFSCLIDGDRTNTRLFEENETIDTHEKKAKLFDDYYEKLRKKLKTLQSTGHGSDKESIINHLRMSMSEQCEEFAKRPSGIYTLSIPTGGGKTLASLRYALKHARLYNNDRIIYVVPYTTIIEQNAEEIRKILKDDIHILEHHSNVIDDSMDDDEDEDEVANIRQKLKLAKDNWDSPVILTTMVQFLNTFYAISSRDIRRLHNLTNAVIIFDEVQKVPVPCVSLFNGAVNFLKKYGHSSIILCTATQPALDFVEHKLEINSDGEMIDHPDQVIKAFKRVEVVDRATDESFNNQRLAAFIVERLEEVRSVLVILNTKSVVKDLYSQLKEMKMDVPVFHLSTLMCAAHRKKILNQVRKLLKNGKKVICVSTQLIEAGVDVSFECVIRSLAGLDSIAQAAGRCNRHGEYGIRRVYVIDHEEETLDRLKEIQVGKQITRKILIDFKNDKNYHGGNVLSKKAMDRYFQEYFSAFKNNLNYFIPSLQKDMTELLFASKRASAYNQSYLHNKMEQIPLLLVNSYKTAAKNFHVIDNITTPVIVPYEEGIDVIAALNGNQSIDDLSQLLRKAQSYSINLYSYEREQLERQGQLVYYLEGQLIALKDGAYNDEFGFDLEGEGGLNLKMF
ncbi:CRISPR-associated helicase Cas3' [Sporolactobacillus sp. THM7-4]|nr:CRISPR-associated helicase Cas3' [Sporolactobacillus sp. THM7-4]